MRERKKKPSAPENQRAVRKPETGFTSSDRLVAVGRIIKPRGLKGELNVMSLSDFSGRFGNMRTVYIEFRDGVVAAYEVEYTKISGTAVIVKLKEINDRTAAETFKGAFICITRDDVAPLSDDSFYIFDLEGMDVYDAAGGKIGTVIRIERYPAQDIIVVGMKDCDVMVPAVKEYVLDVDVSGKRMTVRIPEGLPLYPKGKV
ncbi:ribosome maturation factor RimM [bacterium]|nr:ribosome maturation factor RimM [bacterium]